MTKTIDRLNDRLKTNKTILNIYFFIVILCLIVAAVSEYTIAWISFFVYFIITLALSIDQFIIKAQINIIEYMEENRK